MTTIDEEILKKTNETIELIEEHLDDDDEQDPVEMVEVTLASANVQRDKNNEEYRKRRRENRQHKSSPPNKKKKTTED